MSYREGKQQPHHQDVTETDSLEIAQILPSWNDSSLAKGSRAQDHLSIKHAWLYIPYKA